MWKGFAGMTRGIVGRMVRTVTTMGHTFILCESVKTCYHMKISHS